MNLPKRLDTIQKLIDDDSNVIDVGCDHALLDIYLTLYRKNINCVACDVNEKALNMAKTNIKKYNLEEKIKTVLSNGLNNISSINDSVIVISGMGTSTIKDILSDDRINNVKKIIIQSNNEHFELRKYMQKKDFYISNEVITNDRDKDYIIIVFERGKKIYKYFELVFGPILLKNRKIYEEYFSKQLEKLKKVYHKIPKKYIMLKLKTLKKIMYLTKEKK